jgi:hypothetical protein
MRGLPFGDKLAERRGRLALFYAGGGIGTAGYRRAFLLALMRASASLMPG